jgi:hypothetical protein
VSCPGYRPPYGTGQLDGSTYAGVNCNCWSAAQAAQYDSCGARDPSAATVRLWTGDKSGGTTLSQTDDALRVHLGIDLDTRYSYPWSDFVRRVNGGAAAILQGWYKPILATRFAGSETFSGNHSMLILPGLVAMDPLADGRRVGIYKYHGEAYPEALLKDFAGRLNVGGSSYRPLGSGLVYASFTRDNEPNYKATLPTGSFWVYGVAAGVITGRKGYTRGGGSTVPCGAPRLYKWPGHSSKSLVKVTKGIYDGRYVSTTYAHPT